MNKIVLTTLLFSLLLFGCVQQGAGTNSVAPTPTPSPSQITSGAASPTTTTASATQPAQTSPTPSANSAGAIKEFAVKATHTAYIPDKFEVNQGDTVKFLLTTGAGQVPHNHGITIDEYNINAAATSDATPVEVSFVASKTGEFKIWCKTCLEGVYGVNHPKIEGTLVVK